MAHRKPLGTTFTTTLEWEGEQPELGDYLISSAGTWYRVNGVIEKENPAKVGLTLERVAGAAQDEHHVRTHPFAWYRRTPSIGVRDRVAWWRADAPWPAAIS